MCLMIINFKKGEMLVQHSTGHVDKYQRLDIENLKTQEESLIRESQEKIKALNEYISKITLSIGVI